LNTSTATEASDRLPAASRAATAIVCGPFGTEVLLHVNVYGADVRSAPSGAPSRRNCTPATPTSSDAVATRDTDPDTVL
jgi:hypothetical protein